MKKICLFFPLLFIIGCIIICCTVVKKSENECEGVHKTGIVVRSTPLYRDSNYMETICQLYENDLVFVISKTQNGFYIQMPITSIPPTNGFVTSNSISFDSSTFDNANYGILLENTPIYNTPNLNDVYSVESSKVVHIIKREEGWILCELPAGEGNKWVEAKNIAYELNKNK